MSAGPALAPQTRFEAHLEDYAELRSWGLTRRQAAERMHVSLRTIERYETARRRREVGQLRAAPSAHPARQVFGRTAVVHAVAAQRVDVPRLTLGRGEPLCGTFADLEPCPPGLFAATVTCGRCLAVIEQVHVEVTG